MLVNNFQVVNDELIKLPAFLQDLYSTVVT